MTKKPQTIQSVIFFSFITIFSFFLFLIIFAKAPMFKSFWLDECITAWVVQPDTFKEVIARAWGYQAQSPLYFMILKLWSLLTGDSDFALRSFSLLCSFFSIFITYYIFKEIKFKFEGETTQRKYNSFIPFFVILLTLVLNEDFIKTAFTARPYALGLLFVNISTLIFFRIINNLKEDFNRSESNKTDINRTKLKATKKIVPFYFLSLLTTFYIHYLFIGVVFLHLYILLQNKNLLPSIIKNLRNTILISSSISTIFSLPGLYHMYIWSHKINEVNFNEDPDALQNILQYVKALFPRHISIYLILALFLAFCFSKLKLTFPISTSTPKNKIPNALKIPLFWALIPAVLLIFLQLITGGTFIIDRYYLWRCIGISILVTLIFLSIEGKKSKAIFISTFVFFGLFLEIQRKWVIEDWKEAQKLIKEDIQERNNGMPYPTLVYTGLAEADSIKYYAGYLNRPEDVIDEASVKSSSVKSTTVKSINYSHSKQYLTSPFLRYDLTPSVFPIPPSFEPPEFQNYFDEVFIQRNLLLNGFYLVYAYNNKVDPDNYTQLFEKYNLKQEWYTRLGTLTVEKYKINSELK